MSIAALSCLLEKGIKPDVVAGLSLGEYSAHVCSGTLDFEDAVKLAKQNSYKFKIVTLKGDVINPSGAISGGSVQEKTVSILGRGKEIKALEQELMD